MARKIKGAILFGMIITSIIGLFMGLIEFKGFFSAPPSIAPTLFKLDIPGALNLGIVTVIGIFLMMDMFDTVGTLVGVTQAAGIMKDNKIPRVQRALLADAIGTVSGALLGTSTVTSYIESTAGVREGGRTGLTTVTVGVLMLAALFFSPLVAMIGGGYAIKDTAGNLLLHPLPDHSAGPYNCRFPYGKIAHTAVTGTI